MGLNPQQLLFKECYLDPGSETFGNAKGSALAAGYSEDYALNITRSKNTWVSELVRDMDRLSKAEMALDEALSLPIDKETEDRISTAILEKKTKVAMFVAKGMAKHKYSERVEQTGADGKDLQINLVSYGDKVEDE